MMRVGFAYFGFMDVSSFKMKQMTFDCSVEAPSVHDGNFCATMLKFVVRASLTFCVMIVVIEQFIMDDVCKLLYHERLLERKQNAEYFTRRCSQGSDQGHINLFILDSSRTGLDFKVIGEICIQPARHTRAAAHSNCK